MTVAELRPPPILEGPPGPELVHIRDVIYRATGIFHPDNKLALLLDRCGRRMKEVEAKNLRAYKECLTTNPVRHGELMALLNEITIGETCFFRNQPQLDAFCDTVLPKIIEAKAKVTPRRIRIWSAGCSTGEEPYTLSMMLLQESSTRLKDWAIEILATDLNERSLAHAKRGIYGPHSTRNVTAFHRQKYFLPAGDEFQIRPAVRANTNFNRLNLSDDVRMSLMKNLDAIYCCNVLIYFDFASKRRVIRHFYDSLLPHGYLFLGHAESLFGVSDDFRLIHLAGATAYVKSESAPGGK